ncbi:hypothetical protein K469DRAFT_682581 [Zopfia rhizophila CBS 207.26]|uniref:Uncharacterized protein n=1 Tax=Zopfia rhizophila CBS 207.26 TaxID=1314779 RepID=A0A6A6DDG3_9PEZI|nr:hypothetical protein K469DRAFT_682581 [Zopfia rhizophila CBS 207.26]
MATSGRPRLGQEGDTLAPLIRDVTAGNFSAASFLEAQQRTTASWSKEALVGMLALFVMILIPFLGFACKNKRLRRIFAHRWKNVRRPKEENDSDVEAGLSSFEESEHTGLVVIETESLGREGDDAPAPTHTGFGMEKSALRGRLADTNRHPKWSAQIVVDGVLISIRNGREGHRKGSAEDAGERT